jgi:3-oxoacyl-[acyl-carrier protein] reductase
MTKNAIVTGAAKGIGYQIALRLTKDFGYKVLAISRNQEALEKLQKQAGPDLSVLPFDLETGNYQTLINFITTAEWNSVDVLINNAGYLVNKPFTEISTVELHQSYAVNVFSPFMLIQHLLPYMLKAESAHIVNISSMGGFQGSQKFAGLSAYSSSKGALAVLTECLAEELKDSSVKLNCLCLGAVQTEMLSAAFPGYQAPLTAMQMSAYIARFAHEAHHFINGKIIPVSISTP